LLNAAGAVLLAFFPTFVFTTALNVQQNSVRKMLKNNKETVPCIWCNANKEDNVDLCEDCIRLRYTGGRFMACCPCGVIFNMGSASMCEGCLIDLGRVVT